MSRQAAYYCPTIPDVYSTDRYQHALALAETTDEFHVLSNNPVPESLTALDGVSEHVIDATGILDKSQSVLDVVAGVLDPESVLCTSYHYEAVVAGLRAKRAGFRWIADVYETPAQYRLNQPRSYHQITARGLAGLLSFSDRGIHSFHPDTPYQYGSDRRFVPNGAPTDRVEGSFHERDGLHVVWVGSPRWDRGGKLLFEALRTLDRNDVRVDVYGTPDERLVDRVQEAGLSDTIVHHGRVDHNQALRASEDADVGYCVLPHRTDWYYAPPIKVGEYLAGGAIPLLSDFPGMRMMAEDVAVYAEPTGRSVADRLEGLLNAGSEEQAAMATAARQRAEAIPWPRVREQFATAVGVKH